MTLTGERPTSPAIPLSANSLPAQLRGIAEDQPDRVALREKVFGVWEETTYSGYWEMVQVVGAALMELGVDEGDRIAIHSENRKAWVYSELGAHAIKAVSVGIYPTNPAAEVGYLLRHSESKVLVAEDQEQVDKALAVKDQLPDLRYIVFIEPRGLTQYDDPLLVSWDDFVEMGRARLSKEPGLVADIVDAIDPEDMACLVYTSGTTGPPKGAMLSHRNLIWVGDNAVDGLVGLESRRLEYLSYLPLCHILEKLFTVVIGLKTRASVNFAESIDTVAQDLVEVQPTLFAAVPRIWEKMEAGVVIRMSDASRLKQLMYQGAFRVGSKNADRILTKGGRGVWGNIQHGLFHVLVYRSLREKLGLRYCESAISGAAPIAPELLKFFMSLGVPIREGYGMTENIGYATVNREDAVKIGTVGEPYPETNLKLGDDGEILMKHPGVFMGYFKNPEATAEAIDQEGYLHTGDVGEWDGGHLRLVDRKKDIIITSGGKNLSPSEIENKLKVSPFVKEAIVVGDGRKFVSALIGIEFDTVSNWALRRNLPFTTYRDLSEKPEVRELIARVVADVNEDFAQAEQIKQFRLIPKELDHEDGELTATQKVKRSEIESRFGDLIGDIYGVS
jgi:long-chain acyl-CoA synthetase